MVKIVKNAIRNRTGSLQTRLHRFLLSYPSSPHSSTGQSPAELLLGRQLRTRLDVFRPSLRQSVELKQHAWKNARDLHSSDRLFTVGDPVYVCLVPGPGAPWVPGTITAGDGQICTVQLADGRSFTRHRDHVRPRVCTLPSCVSGRADPAPPVPDTTIPSHCARAPDALEARSAPASAASETLSALEPQPRTSAAAAPAAPGTLPESAPPSVPVVSPPCSVVLRRSARVRRAPARYGVT